MSRLADRLNGLDKVVAGPSGMGVIPGLTGRISVRSWRRGLLFAIVGGMLVAGMAVTMWPAKVAVTTPGTSPPATAISSWEPPARALSDDRFEALVRRAHDAARAGSLADAIASFREALLLRPNDAAAWSDLGVVLVGRGDVDEGIEALRRALRASPKLAGAHKNLAVALDRRGQPREALAHYQAFLALAPRGDRARDEVTRRVAEVGAAAGK